MRPRFLADENLSAKIIAGLLRREPAIDFQTAKAAGIMHLPDPIVLEIAAQEGRVLVSHDRETIPGHFSRFITQGTSAGVLIVPQSLAIREAIEEILLVWTASSADEWQNRLRFLPI